VRLGNILWLVESLYKLNIKNSTAVTIDLSYLKSTSEWLKIEFCTCQPFKYISYSYK
jgi:hypothetical protein